MRSLQNVVNDVIPYEDQLLTKIEIYLSTIWADRRQTRSDCNDWLSNFSNNPLLKQNERIHALYLLSKFMYFGNTELRELLVCLYRDLFKYHIIKNIRKNNSDIKDESFLKVEFLKELNQTRFLGVGNPSESGVHLLYYFRQENVLSKEYFINAHEIFNKKIIKETDDNGVDSTRMDVQFKDENVKRYIFIDDFCGSGTQAKRYSADVVDQIKQINPDIEVNYLMLFATDSAINKVRTETLFDRVETVFKIDDSFKCFSPDSRYFKKDIEEIDKNFCHTMCNKHGVELYSDHPLGYKDGQLLLSMFHNTPDNSLPIFWSVSNDWKPIFKRFSKIY